MCRVGHYTMPHPITQSSTTTYSLYTPVLLIYPWLYLTASEIFCYYYLVVNSIELHIYMHMTECGYEVIVHATIVCVFVCVCVMKLIGAWLLCE